MASFISLILLFININTTYLCENNPLYLTIRNNINGDSVIVENISTIKPGAFINLKWRDKNLMLPYSPRIGLISFSDKKWDWRYEYDENENINEENPTLNELLGSGRYQSHECKLVSTLKDYEIG